MVKTTSLVPGRMYSFVYVADVDMVGERDFGNGKGKQANPLDGALVTVRRVCSVQAAGAKTYANLMLKLDSEWQKSERKDWATVTPDNSCILEHNKTGVRYLRAIPRAITKEEYQVDGKPATDSQVEAIQSFKKSRKEEKPVYIRFRLDNIANLVDDGGESE